MHHTVLLANKPIPLAEAPDALHVLQALARVPCGFPSPAQDHTQQRIDLNQILVLNPLSTFLFIVSGDSMTGAGIGDGDRLVVDRSIEARHGLVVLASVDGEFTVKRLYRRAGVVKLMPANPAFQPIEFLDGQEMSVFGVVTWNLRQVLATKGRPGAA